ncbi:MAG: hypothetical protein OHK0017_10810 [Patescibacteria group bacterium]
MILMQKELIRNMLLKASKLIVGLVFLLFFFGTLLNPTLVKAQTTGGVTDFSGGGFTACNLTPDQVQASANGKALESCVRSVMQFALVIAGIVAMIQLALAAFNYYNPEVNTKALQSSIDTIRNVFIGLMLIAGPVMILGTFNTSLLNLQFLGFTSTSSSSGSTSSGNTAGTSTGKVVTVDAQGNIQVNTSNVANSVQSITQLADICNNPTGTRATQCAESVATVLRSLSDSVASLTSSQITTLRSGIDKLREQGVNINENLEAQVMLGSDGNNTVRPASLDSKDDKYTVSTQAGGLTSKVGGKIVFHFAVSYVNESGSTVRKKIDVYTNQTSLDQIYAKMPTYLEPFMEYTRNSNNEVTGIKVKTGAVINLEQFNTLCSKSSGCRYPSSS